MKKNVYRGISLSLKQWVYGDLIQLHDGRKFIVNHKFGACFDDDGNFINTGNPFVHEIDPKTLGQMTGLKDKNDNMIYEGDIARHLINLGMAGDIEKVSEVKLNGFGINLQHWIFDQKWSLPEVIGNIHENNIEDYKEAIK